MGLPCGFDGTSVGHPWGSHETSDGLSWPFERSTINSHSMGLRWKWNTPFLRYFDGMPIGHPKALMEFTRTTYSSAIGFGTSVGLPWCSHGAPKDVHWVSTRLPWDQTGGFSWNDIVFNGNPWVFLWEIHFPSLGLPWDCRWIPMEIPRGFHDACAWESGAFVVLAWCVDVSSIKAPPNDPCLILTVTLWWR